MQTDVPVITITTDFGHKGPFVGVMKGVIASRAPGATVIDMTHEVPVHWPPEAGFWLARSYRYFPAGTVHVAVVDPGVGTERDILIATTDEHLFIAPDNGLLDELLHAAEAPVVYRLDDRYRDVLNLPAPSNTFHGRDIFAPVAATLAAETDRSGMILRIAKPVTEWTPGWIDPPETRAGQVRGQIITIDHFGNLISNIGAELLPGDGAPVARIAGRDIPMEETYGRAEPGKMVALVNSFGVVEIARTEGNAAATLGVSRGAPLVISLTDG
jgi:S-adenosylmethionine hydrolase